MYEGALQLGKERHAILLDIGCCCGSLETVCITSTTYLHRVLVENDVRKAVADGYPAETVITSDIELGEEANTASEAIGS